MTIDLVLVSRLAADMAAVVGDLAARQPVGALIGGFLVFLAVLSVFGKLAERWEWGWTAGRRRPAARPRVGAGVSAGATARTPPA